MKRFLFTSSLLLGIFANAQISSIKENFEGADLNQQGVGTCGYMNFPYNGWASDKVYPYSIITYNCTTLNNKYAKAYSGMSLEPIHFISPELISTEGKLSLGFNGVGGKLEIGTVTDIGKLSEIQIIKEYTIAGRVSASIDIPNNEGKFIVFKFTPNNFHQVFGIDNIEFSPQILSTNEFQKKAELKFAIDLLNNRLIFNNNDIKSVKILTANGSLVSNEKITNNSINISKLLAGVYFIIAENELGNSLNSKFIKN